MKTNIWFKFTVGVLFIFPVAGFVALFAVLGAFHDKALLKANGIPVAAQVSDLQVETRRGSGVRYVVRYQFQASPLPARPHSYTGEGDVSEDQYHSLRIGQSVPVLYDRARPANSGLDINDSLRTSDPYKMMPLLMAEISALFGGLFLLLMSVVLFYYFKEKGLVQWGHVAPATILKEEEIGGRHARMTATYQFVDEQGRTLVSVQKNLPSAKRLGRPGFREFKRSVMENPIALYDPQNSEKSMLYRAGFLTATLP